jgi:hypothetical protein
MKRIIFAVLFSCFLVVTAQAKDVTLKWDVVTGATGYKLYYLLNVTDISAVDWSSAVMVNITDPAQDTYVYTDIPLDGFILFRVSAYNSVGESISHDAGAWFNALWGPPPRGTGLGIE